MKNEQKRYTLQESTPAEEASIGSEAAARLVDGYERLPQIIERFGIKPV